MKKNKHIYEVKVYVGKELKQELDLLSIALNIPVATLCRALIKSSPYLRKEIEINVI